MSDGRTVPSTTARPTFSGTNTVGSVQTGVNATFTGSGTITVTRAWVRDNTEIPGQTGATYTLTASDTGKTVRFRNKASNLMGTTTIDSLGRVGG
jgi:copper(I)-binding protein